MGSGRNASTLQCKSRVYYHSWLYWLAQQSHLCAHHVALQESQRYLYYLCLDGMGFEPDCSWSAVLFYQK